MNENKFIKFFKGLRRSDKDPNVETEEMLEARAREAVTIFLQSETQTPLVKYHANGENTFNVQDQTSERGTILRVDTNQKDFEQYLWLVCIPSKETQSVSLWNIIADPGNPESRGVRLISKNKFVLSRLSGDILYEIVIDDFLDPIIYEKNPPLKVEIINIMSGGMTERKKDPAKNLSSRQRVPNGAGGLVPNQGFA